MNDYSDHLDYPYDEDDGLSLEELEEQDEIRIRKLVSLYLYARDVRQAPLLVMSALMQDISMSLKKSECNFIVDTTSGSILHPSGFAEPANDDVEYMSAELEAYMVKHGFAPAKPNQPLDTSDIPF